MLRLPVELRRSCLQALELGNTCPNHNIELFDNDDHGAPSVDTLKNLRLVNADIGALATEQLFHTATLYNTDESAAKFRNLLSSPLKHLVHRVIVKTGDEYSQSWNLRYDADEEEPQETCSEAISNLSEFRNLEEVDVRFTKKCALPQGASQTMGWPAGRHAIFEQDVPQTNAFRNRVLETVFAALQHAEATCLHTLSIRNLQDYHDPLCFHSDAFLALRQRVKRLHLQIATEDDDNNWEHNIEMVAPHHFYAVDLAEIWLAPLSKQLTHLTLYGAQMPWGVCPWADFRKIPPFARLTSLSLGNFSIVHDWHIDWIVSHASTLQELLLDSCFIGIALCLLDWQAKRTLPLIQGTGRGRPDTIFQRTELRWHAVFRRFRSQLLLLTRFAFGSGDWQSGRAFNDRYALSNKLLKKRYAMFDCHEWREWGSRGNELGFRFFTGGRWVVEPAPDCDADDMDALKELLRVVKARDVGTV